MSQAEPMTFTTGRSIVAYYRDKMELSNRDLARVFQDYVAPDAFINFMNGDNSALSEEQAAIIGNEVVHYLNAEDQTREEAARAGLTPPPGVREVLGIKF